MITILINIFNSFCSFYNTVSYFSLCFKIFQIQFNPKNNSEERPAIQEENVLVPEPSSVTELVQSELPLTNENEQQERSNTGDLNANVNELSSQNITTFRTVPLKSLSVSSEENQEKMGTQCYSDVSSSANLSRFSRGSSKNAKRKQVLRKRLRSGKTLDSKGQSLKGNTSTKSSNKAKSHYLSESKNKHKNTKVFSKLV